MKLWKTIKQLKLYTIYIKWSEYELLNINDTQDNQLHFAQRIEG
jgi:hypothetical protein